MAKNHVHAHNQKLREVAKFAAGLVAGDFLCGLWVYSSQLLPLEILGITFTRPLVVAWMIFDLAVLILLVYYGWHANTHSPSLRERWYFMIVGVLLGLVTILHLVRVIYDLNANIGGWPVPFWLSWTAVVVAGYLSYTSFRFASSTRKR